ncbi:DUF2202 domain-containing protein [Thermotomaculum hydrothermale]|nr:DUF2202 domain-containing protein [Thermotomaculum hydrothermale]
MKKILSILTIAILLAVPAMAGNGRGACGNGGGSALGSTYYDVSQETTINATVIGFDTVYPSRLIVTMEDSRQLAVFMAPKWYLAQQNITFTEGQVITIIGVLTTFSDSTDGIIARQVISGDSLYEFRDANGIPLWISTRGMAGRKGRRGGRGGYGAAAYGNISPCGNLATIISSLPVQDLNDVEVDMLEKMRQEEKLARDVYLTLYEKWGLRIFSNIAQSEQTHMDAVKVLLDKYGLEDPATNNVIGVFTDQAFTDLYNSLVEKGSVSLTEALKVGATIEDLDIKDLEDEIALTNNEDIKMVFQNLMKGSRNHLRSFYRLVVANGETYEPQFISQEEFDSIVNSPMERGVVLDADGNVYSTCGRVNN